MLLALTCTFYSKQSFFHCWVLFFNVKISLCESAIRLTLYTRNRHVSLVEVLIREQRERRKELSLEKGKEEQDEKGDCTKIVDWTSRISCFNQIAIING